MITIQLPKGAVDIHLHTINDLYANFYYEQPVVLLFKLNAIIKRLNAVNNTILNNDYLPVLNKYCKFDNDGNPIMTPKGDNELIDESKKDEFTSIIMGKKQEMVNIKDIPVLTIEDIKGSNYMTPEHINILINYVVFDK